LKPRELPVAYFDLKVTAKFRKSDINPIPPEPMGLLKLCSTADMTALEHGSIRKTLVEWRIQRGQHVLLVNRADRDRTDIAFVNFPSGQRRMAGKQPEDGIEQSCHILIVPPNSSRVMPLVLATGNAGMSRDQITQLLNTMLKRVAENPNNAEYFKRPHPNGEYGREATLKCSFELLPHPSLLLTDVLARGLLNEVEMVAHQVEGIDQYFVQKTQSITIGLVNQGASLRVAQLRNALSLAKIKPDQLVLRFKDPDSGKPVAKTIALNDLEHAMTKRDVIQFDADLSPRYDQISIDILRKLQELV
jgi:hypothetical protein